MWSQPAALAPRTSVSSPGVLQAGDGLSLTGSDGSDEGHQEEVNGVVAGRDDEHHPIGIPADEGRVQLRRLRDTQRIRRSLWWDRSPRETPPLCP